MRIRLKYLDAVRDFITSTDSSIDITQMATPSDRHPDVENLVSAAHFLRFFEVFPFSGTFIFFNLFLPAFFLN